jgi:hypothetical protein
MAGRPSRSPADGFWGMYAFYRIEVTDNGGQPSTVLAEIELLD